MTVFLDEHESDDLFAMLAQLVPLEREFLNRKGKPDIWHLVHDGSSLGWELKQAGELLGSISSVEEQLGREKGGVNRLVLGIRGIITPEGGMCRTWKRSKDIYHRGQLYRTSYKALRAWLGRLTEQGCMVVEVPDLEGLVIAVAALYESSQKPEWEHKTLDRLITQKHYVSELDEGKKRLALGIMGLSDGWPQVKFGEEMALAVADALPTFSAFYDQLREFPEFVEELPMRSGRRIGPAVVKKMREALGC